MSRLRLVSLLIALLFVLSLFPGSRSARAADEPYVFRRSWGGEGNIFGGPSGIAVGSDGTIYVANRGSSRITIIHEVEHTYNTWGGTEGKEAGQFDTPWGITVDNSGNIYVADSENNRIQKFNSQGIYITQWGTLGGGHGTFDLPTDIAVDGGGNVYVVDLDDACIQKFDAQGVFLKQWSIPEFYPEGIAVDGIGNIYITGNYHSSGTSQIQKLDSQWNYITQWGSTGTGEGQLL
jgi:tripartite motif-containing protein 71